MSRHRHKSKESNNNMNRARFNNGPINNYPFGINPQQLLAMLGNNMDIGGLNNILSSMNREGFDFNSFNNPMGNVNGGMSQNNPVGNMNEGNNNSCMDTTAAKKDKNIDSENENSKGIYDDNIELLQSLKAIVAPSKVSFVDKIIELYNNGAFEDKK